MVKMKCVYRLIKLIDGMLDGWRLRDGLHLNLEP
jgi:hypothetical protein